MNLLKQISPFLSRLGSRNPCQCGSLLPEVAIYVLPYKHFLFVFG